MEEEDLLNFITVIDYIGQIENGVAVLLSMRINDDIYELTYWFDDKDNYNITIDERFLIKYKLKSIYEYNNYTKLAYYIHYFVLKNRKEILDEFLKSQTEPLSD